MKNLIVFISMLICMSFLSCSSIPKFLETYTPAIKTGGMIIPNEFILTWHDGDASLNQYLLQLENYGYKEIRRCNCEPIQVLLRSNPGAQSIDDVANKRGAKAKTGSSGGSKNSLYPNIILDLALPPKVINPNAVSSNVINTEAVELTESISSEVDSRNSLAQVRIGILDTPFDLKRRGYARYRLYDKDLPPSDDCSYPAMSTSSSAEINHGTVVAETVIHQVRKWQTDNRSQIWENLPNPGNYEFKIRSFPVLDDQGKGDLFTAICELRRAAAMNMHVIVTSWGFYKPTDLRPAVVEDYNLMLIEFKNCLKRVGARGTAIVAAAGNNGLEITAEGRPFYPASFSSHADIAPEILITTGALEVQESNETHKTAYSNYGKGVVSVGALGSLSIQTTDNQGTSFAAPRVAPWVGLVRAIHGSKASKYPTAFPPDIYPMDNQQ